MRKLYENFHIFHFQKRIVSVETIHRNTVCANLLTSKLPADFVILCTVCWDELWHLLKVMTSSSANYLILVRLVYRFFFHRIFLRLTSLSELWTRFFFLSLYLVQFFLLCKTKQKKSKSKFWQYTHLSDWFMIFFIDSFWD